MITKEKMKEIINYYSKIGFYTFPVGANKQPLTPNGYKDATLDLAVWEQWINKFNPQALAVDCGRSKLVVIDIDVKRVDGFKSLEKLELGIDYKNSFCSMTPTKGMHIFFTNNTNKPIKNSISRLGEGIDVKSNGGYVVLPPSEIATGIYAKYGLWKGRPANIPDKLLKLLENIEKQESINIQSNTSDKTVFKEGERNDNLFRLACSLWVKNITEETLVNAILMENSKRCEPPLSESEVRTIVKSAMKYSQSNSYTNQKEEKRNDIYWLFAASVYSDPETAIATCAWLSPEAINNYSIRLFWTMFLETRDHVKAADGAGILSDIIDWTAKLSPSDTALQFADRIDNDKYFSDMDKLSHNLKSAIYNRDIGKLNETIKKMYGYTSNPDGRRLNEISSAVSEFKNLVSSNSDRIIKTGINKFDSPLAICGLERQTLSIIAGRPSMGKSALAWQIAQHVSKSYKVLYYSLEMSTISLLARSICPIANVQWALVKSGNLNDSQKARLFEAAEKFSATHPNLIVDDNPKSTIEIWKDIMSIKPDLVVVDHIRLLSDKGDNENLRLGNITYKLKEIAKVFNCHVLCVAQLNRGTEARTDKIPQLSDLRESGQIEENADLVLMLHREDYYENSSIDKTIVPIDVWVRKNRDGISGGKISLQFDLPKQIIIGD